MTDNKDKGPTPKADSDPAPAPNPVPTPTPAPSGAEQYISKIIRYIPGPIIASYTAMTGLIAEDPSHIVLLSWAVFGLCLVLSPLYVLFMPDSIQDNKDCSKRFHVLASIIAFGVWGFALGGPFALTFAWYKPLYGSLALIVSTLLMPLLEKVLMLFNFFKFKNEG